MKRRNIMAILVTAILGMGLISTHAAEQQTEVKKQTKCPVMGGKINKAQYADVQGKRIYVCCAGCIAKIEAEPAKYIKQLEAEGITLDKAENKKTDSGHKNPQNHGGHHH